jgi:hypothetical protein
MHCGRRLGARADVQRVAAGEVVVKAFVDAFARVRSQGVKLAVFVVLAAIIGGLAAAAPPGLADEKDKLNAATTVLLVFMYPLAWILQYFVIADSIRAVVPAFHMNFVNLLLTIAIGFAFNVMVEIGFVLLVVPGIFVAVRFSVWLQLQLQGERDAFVKSWEFTGAQFWQTLLVDIVSWGILLFSSSTIFTTSYAIVNAVPVAAAVVAPVAMVIGFYVATIAWLSLSYWAAALRGQLTSAG